MRRTISLPIACRTRGPSGRRHWFGKTPVSKRHVSPAAKRLGLEQLEDRALLSTGYGGAFSLYTDVTRTTTGLVGSYVNDSLRAVDELDWRDTQTISGQRVDPQLFFPWDSMGSRSDVGVTGGSDENWDNFSVQWDGILEIHDPDTTLALRSDDGSRLWVDRDNNGTFGNLDSEAMENGWGQAQGANLSAPSAPLSPGTYPVRIQYEDEAGGNTFSLIANPIQPQGEFAVFTDETLTTPGLVGSYIDDNLRHVDQLDWRTTQTVSGTRVDPNLDFTSLSWGVRSEVGLTNGSDGNWENFSAQWDGYVQILKSGTSLATRSDDSSRMWLDLDGDGLFGGSPDESIDNHWGNPQATTTGASSAGLPPGVYPIRIQYEESGGGNVLQLIPGTTHSLRVGYIIPHNRQPQVSAVANLQDYLVRFQDWYRDQMDRHGFGPKTLPFETEQDGVTPKIHSIHVGVTDDVYHEDIWGNSAVTAAAAGASVWSRGELWLLIPESHRQNADGSVDGGAALGGSFGSGSDGGVAIMGGDSLFRMSSTRRTDDRPYAGIVVPEIGPYPLVQAVSFPGFEGDTFSSISSSIQGATVHELAHGLGLGHDFRNDGNFHGNVMGNGLRGFRGAVHPDRYPEDDMRLARGAALVLNASRYFNVGAVFDDEARPTLSIATTGTVTPSNGLLEVAFTASDDRGLAVALLRRNGNTIGEQPLSGTSFDGSFVTPYYETDTDDQYQISVYDLQGNRQDQSAIIRVASGSNRAPEPSIRVFHSNSRLGDEMTLDASFSSDADHDQADLLVEWDLDGDGTFDTAPTTDKMLTFTPAQPGTFLVTARITDPAGAQSIAAPIAVRVAESVDVNDVLVSGESWHAELAPISLIDRPDSEVALPWINLNRLQIVFDLDVEMALNSLTLVGVNTPESQADGFHYAAETFTATWTFATPLGTDKYQLNLTGGEPADGAPLGIATGEVAVAGGRISFQLRFDVLAGDVTGDAVTDIGDLVNIATRVPSSVDQPSSPAYEPQFDVSGDGSIDIGDLVNVATRVPSSLPEDEPGDVTLAVTSTADSGPGSLRQAILVANAATADVTIKLQIPIGQTRTRYGD